MAITSADPDDNPVTPSPALSFGPAATQSPHADSNADGGQSLRVEFPHETNTAGPNGQPPRQGASLSEYYRGAGVVPYGAGGAGATEVGEWTDDELVEYNPDKQPPNAYVDTLEHPPVPYTGLYYVRRVTAAGAAALGSSRGYNEGDLIFAWGSRTTDEDTLASEFIIPNGAINQAYTHEGYQYSTGADASGVQVILYLNIMNGVSQFNLRDIWNSWFETYYIKRRISNTNLTPEINENIPIIGSGKYGTNPPIKFSDLYGAVNYVSRSKTIIGHNAQTYGTIGAGSNYISNSYPTTITTDGTDVRSGNHSATTGSNSNQWRSALVPMGTFYVDPNLFPGDVRIKYPVITYRSSGDVDPGDGRVDVRNVGVKVNHLGSNNAQTGIMLATDIFTLIGADGQSLNSSHNPRTINTDGTFNATTNKTGRFIVYLTFQHYQTSDFADPDLNIKVNDFVIEWETA